MSFAFSISRATLKAMATWRACLATFAGTSTKKFFLSILKYYSTYVSDTTLDFIMSGEGSKAGGTYCCVVGCHRNEKADGPVGIKFFSFPARNEEQKRLWAQAVKRKNVDGTVWQPTKTSKICSEHFAGNQYSHTRGHPDYVPSIFPTKHIREKTFADAKRHDRAMKRRMTSLTMEGSSLSFTQYSPVPSTSVVTLAPTTDPTLAPVACETCDEITKKNVTIQTDNKTKNKSTQSRIAVHSRKQQTDRKRSRMEGLQMESFKESQLVAFTGISSKFLALMEKRFSQKITNSYKLSSSEKIQLVFVKLKLNVSFTALSGMFNMSVSRTVTVFSQTLTTIYQDFKDLLCWFCKKRVQSRMPACFKGLFPNARAIIDATEFPCEKPASKKLEVQFYSHYKGRHTLKCLIAIAPSGEITFLSKACGGRTTDTELTTRSGFLKLIEPGDVILADKGFPKIETDLNVRGGVLVMPPVASGERQFTSQENRQGFECATVRIHVERAIRRMKYFEVLHFVNTHMFKYIDKVLVVISVTCNCFNDLIKE